MSYIHAYVHVIHPCIRRVPGDRETDADGHHGWRQVGMHEAVRGVYNGQELQAFVRQLFARSSSVKLFPEITWLRLKGGHACFI